MAGTRCFVTEGDLGRPHAFGNATGCCWMQLGRGGGLTDHSGVRADAGPHTRDLGATTIWLAGACWRERLPGMASDCSGGRGMAWDGTHQLRIAAGVAKHHVGVAFALEHPLLQPGVVHPGCRSAELEPRDAGQRAISAAP